MHATVVTGINRRTHFKAEEIRSFIYAKLRNYG